MDEYVPESHHHALLKVIKEGRSSSEEQTTTLAAGIFTTRLLSDGTKGEVIAWRGPAGVHSAGIANDAVVDLLGDIMHL